MLFERPRNFPPNIYHIQRILRPVGGPSIKSMPSPFNSYLLSFRQFFGFICRQLTQLRDIILLPLPSNFSDSAEYAELNIAFEKIWRLFFYSIISLAKRHPSLKRDVLPAWILDPSIHFYSSIFDNLRGLRSLQYSVLIHIGDLCQFLPACTFLSLLSFLRSL